VFDDSAEQILGHLVEQGYFERDGPFLHIGPEAERRFGRRYFSDLTAVFSAPPEFTVLAGRSEIGTIGTDVLLDEVNETRFLLLGGRSWKMTHIDWDRRPGGERADVLTRSLPRRAWQRRSVGMGAKGDRWYSWVLIDITDSDADGAAAGQHHLLVRRNDKTGELAYYRCYSRQPATLADYVRVAGWRWKVEESFQTSKELTGLDEHQVRRWTSWHRWVTLAMLAHAFLVVTTAAQRCADSAGTTLSP
jgi:hypothetical protein